MAHGAAIFPYLAGSRGTWLWGHEANGNAGDGSLTYGTHEWFLYGLYRLSRCGSFFEGPHTFWAPTDAAALFDEETAVIRGVIRGERLLVAVQNPYAETGQSSTVDIEYEGTTLGQVSLDGPAVELAVFDLP